MGEFVSKEMTIYESDEIKKTARMRGEFLLISNYVKHSNGELGIPRSFNFTVDELEKMLKVAKGEEL